ncbi:MAG: hypothetical protein NVS4B1_36830 [Ktedonobacteraceae bacterium]
MVIPGLVRGMLSLYAITGVPTYANYKERRIIPFLSSSRMLLTGEFGCVLYTL